MGGESEERDSIKRGHLVEDDGVVRKRGATTPGSSSAEKEETSGKSNSGSSQCNSHPVAGGAATGTSSSGTGSHGSTQLAMTDILERLAFAQDARVKAEDDLSELRDAMAAASAEHGVKVADLQKKLLKALMKEKERGINNSELMQKLAALEATKTAMDEDLKQQLQSARKSNMELISERNAEEDRLAGVEARSKERMENLKVELEEQHVAKVQKEAMATAAMRKELEVTNAEMFSLQRQLAAKMRNQKEAAENAGMAPRTGRVQMDAQAAETSRLKGMLDAANRELRILNASLEEPGGGDEDERSNLGIPSDTKLPPRPRRRLKQLEAALASQRESHREMSDELSELRLQMSGMEQGHQAQIGDLQSLLDQANQKLLDGGISGAPSSPAASLSRTSMRSRRGTGAVNSRRSKKNDLASIDEEDDDDIGSNDGSIAASGNVSSTAGDGVGDLRDFDDVDAPLASVVQVSRKEDLERIDFLDAELARAREEIWKLREELAGSRAELTSKNRRLTESLNMSLEGDAYAKQELATLKQTLAGKDAKHAAQLESIRNKLSASESDVAEKDEYYRALLEEVQRKEAQHQSANEEAKEELFRALEAKRIAVNRIEDMKRELESTHRRHEVIVADFKMQLARAEQCGGRRGSVGRDDHSELQSLREQLHGTIEDKNILTNKLECQEVSWKSKLDHMELENKQTVADLKRQHSDHIAKLQSKLDETKAEFKQRLAKAEQEKQEAEERAAPPVPSKNGAVAATWVSLLRCPTRMAEAGSKLGAVPSATASGAPEALYCRDVSWQVLNSVHGVISFLCDSPGLKILQSSERANMIWGSNMLVGSLVVSLLAVPASAAWLRRAILTHQALAKMEGAAGDVPGFAIHTLGRLEFREGSNGSFESQVTVAHLPAEPRLGREASVVVLVEPLLTAAANKRTESRSGRSEARGQRTQSVVSDDVQPDDSASNIAQRYF